MRAALFLALVLACPAPAAVRPVVLSAMGSLQAAGKFKIGFCHDNVMALADELGAKPGFAPERARALIITRPVPIRDFREPNVPLLRVRGEGSETASFHIVLSYEGRIYDPSAVRELQGLPTEEYLRAMMIKDGEIAVRQDVSLARQERLRSQAERNAFRDAETLMSELAIREMSIDDYRTEIYPHFAKWRGMPPVPEKDLDPRAPPRSAAVHLGKPDPARRREPRPEPPEPVWERVGDATVRFEDSELEIGDLRQVANAVQVSRPGQKYAQWYNRTDRDFETLSNYFYPKEMLDLEEFKGKVVLDGTTGGGLFVEELRERGIVAYGMDAALHARQRARMHADARAPKANTILLPNSLETRPFLWGNAAQTGIADKQADFIYDTYGIFEYEFWGDPAFVAKVFLEWKRVLKTGGKLRFGPVGETYEQRIRDFVATLPGYRLTGFGSAPGQEDHIRAVELERVD